MGKFIFYLAIGISICGCAHIVSEDILQEVDTEVAFTELRKAPQKYMGKVVLLGGIIVKTVNKKGGTLLEVYQTELDRYGSPINIDISSGRFLVYSKGFLDSEIYRKGRKITIVGVVEKEEIMRLGEIDYRYPYLVAKKLHLWREEQSYPYALHPWAHFGPWPYHPWYRWYDPYYRYR